MCCKGSASCGVSSHLQRRAALPPGTTGEAAQAQPPDGGKVGAGEAIDSGLRFAGRIHSPRCAEEAEGPDE